MPAPPPPPPPPPPMPSFGGPPPPPPPPPAALPARPDNKTAKGRGALLGDIEKGARLKKVGQINDRSAPIIDKSASSNAGPPVGAAPPVPGGLRPPTTPGLPNRARSSSDAPAPVDSTATAPQLGGLFAAGMPKLRKSAGGVNIYDSDPETTSRKVSGGPSRAPPLPNGAAPPLPPGAAPSLPSAPRPMPGVAALRNNLRQNHSSASLVSGKPKPAPPPIGKKPPIPPPASRKPSGQTPLVASTAPPPPPPPPPASSAPRPPTSPSTAPPPPPLPPQVNGHKEPSLAAQAAMNAFRGASPNAAPPPPPPAAPSRRSADDDYDPYKYDSPVSSRPPPPPPMPSNHSSPSQAPPPPPPSAPPSRPNASAPPPPPPPASTRSSGGIPTAGGMTLGNSGASPQRISPDPSTYTLTNGSPARSRGNSSAATGPGQKLVIQDNRFKFQGDDQLPKPRDFTGGPKRYRAGRGSSVPLDLGSFA